MEILAEAVRFFAGGRQILQGIDLELRPKEFLGIIGPNGSGKSTFLDYKGEAPAAFTLEFLNEHRGVKGYKQTGYSAVVPGFVAGMEKANELFGTMSMAEST